MLISKILVPVILMIQNKSSLDDHLLLNNISNSTLLKNWACHVDYLNMGIECSVDEKIGIPDFGGLDLSLSFNINLSRDNEN